MGSWKVGLRKAFGRGARPPSAEPRCSFCGKRKRDVEKLVAGPGVFICSNCVRLCNEVIAEERAALNAPAALDQLRLAGQQMRLTENHVRGAVTDLRRRGMSWRQIGDALGISRQSAWERFSGEE
jgi:hypothetical protein